VHTHVSRRGTIVEGEGEEVGIDREFINNPHKMDPLDLVDDDNKATTDPENSDNVTKSSNALSVQRCVLTMPSGNWVVRGLEIGERHCPCRTLRC
jgi:hypothetical protein